MGLIRRKAAGASAPAATAPSSRPAIKKTGSFKFDYARRSQEQVRTYAASISGRDNYIKQEIPFFTPRVGDNLIRILPPPSKEKAEAWGHYGVKLALHYGIGVDESAYLCAAKMKSEACPICDERERASRAGEGDLADSLRPRFPVAVFVIDRGQESKGPMLWMIPTGVDKDIVKLVIEPGTGEVLPVDHPDEGFDLAFSREGQGLKTKYGGYKFARRSSPLHDDPAVAEAWLRFICEHPIDEQLVYYEAPYIEEVLSGQAPAQPREDRGEERSPAAKKKGGEEEARPSLKRRGAAPAAAKEPEPKPEEEEELPTYEELCELDEEELATLGEQAGVKFPDAEDAFGSIEDLRDFIAKELGIEIPEPGPETAAASTPSWKQRLQKLAKGDK